MCGVVPGIVTAIALCITVRIIGAVKKGSIPPGGGPKVAVKEKLKSLRLLIPIICLFGLIIGGTFAGWFTATVGGAVGAFVCVVYALFKKMPVKKLVECMMESAIMEAGIFVIIVGGQIFSKFIASAGLAEYLSQAIASVNAPAFIIFLLVILLYIFCGCVMDIAAIIIITVPVVFPILTAVGYSPYVLIIALCFIAEIAGLTPPIGMTVFATANALRINASEIFKGVVPYFVCEVVLVLLIGLFPGIVLCLSEALGVL